MSALYGNFSALLAINGKRYSGAAMVDAPSPAAGAVLEVTTTAHAALRVCLLAPLTSGSITFTVFRNGVATGITVTITPADGTNIVEDVTNTQVYFGKDKFTVEANPVGTGLLGYQASWSVQ